MVTHKGGCHCGAVRFEVEAPTEITVYECNCSMCEMTGLLHLIVPQERFRQTAGEAALADYRFNTGIAHHYFCRHCGVRPFYVPRSNPDGFSVNARCIDPGTLTGVTIEPFDGQAWEANASSLRHLSKAP